MWETFPRFSTNLSVPSSTNLRTVERRSNTASPIESRPDISIITTAPAFRVLRENAIQTPHYGFRRYSNTIGTLPVWDSPQGFLNRGIERGFGLHADQVFHDAALTIYEKHCRVHRHAVGLLHHRRHVRGGEANPLFANVIGADEVGVGPVSYTHMTLPTSDLV